MQLFTLNPETPTYPTPIGTRPGKRNAPIGSHMQIILLNANTSTLPLDAYKLNRIAPQRLSKYLRVKTRAQEMRNLTISIKDDIIFKKDIFTDRNTETPQL